MKKLAMSLLLAVLAAPLYAGVVYEIEVTDHGQSPPKTESIQAAVEGHQLKMGVASKGRGGKSDVIFHGESREMIVVDHDNQSYMVIDAETLKQFASMINPALAQMQEALKGVPEEQRALVEKMMKQRMPQAPAAAERPKTELKKTGERADQNGYPCVKYEVLQGGVKLRELWVTDWSNVDGGDEVIEAFEDMADFATELMDAMPKFGQGGPIADSAFEHMKELGGFPVVTRELGEDGSLKSESSLRSAERRTIDPGEFEPPAGYKRQEMFRGE
jgi:Domain of unknown function (DUF4412)